jgi:hypothetical protein
VGFFNVNEGENNSLIVGLTLAERWQTSAQRWLDVEPTLPNTSENLTFPRISCFADFAKRF